MKTTSIFTCVIVLQCCAISAQVAPTQTAPKQPSYANYSVLLVNPAGGAVALMHNPEGNLEFVDAAKTKQALASGYVPARAAEISELIAALTQQNTALQAENAELKKHPSAPTQSGLNATNCHTFAWLKDATVDQLKTCAALYPATELSVLPTTSNVPAAAPAAAHPTQIEDDAAARRERLITTWMMMQGMNQPKTYNVNIRTSDCTQFPASCAGR